MRKSLVVLLCLCLFQTLTSESCENNPSADQIEQRKQEQIQQQGVQKVPLPKILNYTEKQQLSDIYELRDQAGLICYAYLFSNVSGKLIYLGKCIGYGIPYATQFSSPSKLVNPWGIGNSERGYLPMPQAEPNGLFMPVSSEATWLMLLDKQGKPHPIYCEPNLIVSPFQLDI